MAADQLPSEVREFAHYLDGLLARLDPSGGWCAVFWQRDPEGMRACLDGRELPPWDVVEALLHDLAGQYGPGGAGPESERARTLHASALAAFDARPGARDALGDRLDVMLREQRYAADRQAELTRLLASAATRDQADALRLDLAWVHDDHERATARCAELRARMAGLDRREREAVTVRRGPGGPGSPVRGDGGAPGGAGPGAAQGPHGVGGAPDGYGARRHPSDGPSAAPDEHIRPDPRDPSATTTPAPPRHRERTPDGPGHVAPEDTRHAGSGPGLGGRSFGQALDGKGLGSEGIRRAGSTPGQGDRWFGQAPDETGLGSEDTRHAGSGPGLGGRSFGQAPDETGLGSEDTRHAGSGPGPEGRPGERASGWAAPGEAAADARSQPDAASLSATPEAPASRPFDPPELPAPRPPVPKQRKRRRGSARFAGMAEEEDAAVVVPPAAVPTLPDPAPVTGRGPRGARFAWADADRGAEPAQPPGEAMGVGDRGEVARTVEALARLRGEGRSGEAHALLVEAADCAPATFPLLADELERAGLGADWQTLLWEAASLPAGRLVAAADALGAAGRPGDGQQILRQGVARPPGEVGHAVLGLVAEGRRREVRTLLDAYVRARTPEEAARSVEPDPRRLVPLLLEAAQGVSEERRWDLVHALRVAGFPA
ncbi:conserved hypothetical protein [Streptomyces viridochromogenes DSM 40736]|uniref:UL36 very large tegument protein n=1 Tax=Streptomyces viridochromogenes (strain DSM 40736 / JCM 4977 / BCRC 1201 / Tue 494) TaxID=591159 RepID=D9X479_STRVT|nr:hypothetical protein [Streptomyces viridochromogenes]EFL35907.1 conserved hypothetical protein [Streptomyces viridochromogenes DSM 40736]